MLNRQKNLIFFYSFEKKRRLCKTRISGSSQAKSNFNTSVTAARDEDFKISIVKVLDKEALIF